jgi:hypothetical protein
MNMINRAKGLCSAVCCLVMTLGILAASVARGERAGANAWRLLAVAYPDARDVDVTLGGSERALTARGLAKIKWREGAAAVDITADQVPSPGDIGKNGGQLVLWAIDQDKKIVNLGALQLNGKKLKAKAQAPFRIFGLLITAESDAAAKTPSSAVALESRLPVDPNLVLPVFRIEVPLGS